MTETQWEPIKFSDIKEGDRIRSEAPSGTIRDGVAVSVSIYDVTDGDGNYLAMVSWPTIERAIVPFVPEPYTFFIDKEGDVWAVGGNKGKAVCFTEGENIDYVERVYGPLKPWTPAP